MDRIAPRAVLLSLNALIDVREGVLSHKRMEGYRADLVDLVRGRHVVLMSARPYSEEMPTLHRIIAQTGWEPQQSAFNAHVLPAAESHRLHVKGWLAENFDPGELVAIDRDASTRLMYAGQGIAAYSPEQVLEDPSLLN